MPHPTSRARASRALRRAISLSPSHPLQDALRVLSNPLTYCSSYTHLDDAAWQLTLNYLAVFADRVIQALSNSPNNDVLTSLRDDALEVHAKLDQKGFHTAFFPSHVSATSFFALTNCADSSEQTEANMRIVSTSFPATFQCLKHIFDTPVTLVDPIGTLSNVANRHRRKPPPPSTAIVPPVDTQEFERLTKSYAEFITKLNRVPIPELGRKRVRTFVDLLWQQRNVSDTKLAVEGLSSSIPSYDHVLSTHLSIVVKASLDLSADNSPDSALLWKTAVALKTLGLSPTNHQKRTALLQETLRLKVLSHPCIPVFYGAMWPSVDDTQSTMQYVHIVTERMTKSVRSARHDPALRSFEARMGILRDVADALRYLHAQDMIHGSISPENVLIRISDDRMYGRSKVDVSCLAVAALASNVRKHPLVYQSPEYLNEKKQFFTGDVWSFGVLACFLLAESVDEDNEDDYRFIKAFSELGKEESMVKEWARQISNDRVQELVIRCLHQQPERRPNANDVYTVISEVLREKSVKADITTEAATPAMDSDTKINSSDEAIKETQTDMDARSCRSASESDLPSSSVKNGKLLKSGRQPLREHRRGHRKNYSTSSPNPSATNDSLKVAGNLGDSEGEDSDHVGRNNSDGVGLDNMFKFQVDERGRFRCVKRKHRRGSDIQRPAKRARSDNLERNFREPSKVSAGLRQATMEEIFGPFSARSPSSDPSNSRVKPEDILEKNTSASIDKDSGTDNTIRVKTENTVASSTEGVVTQERFHHGPEGVNEVAKRCSTRDRTKREPRIESLVQEGAHKASATENIKGNVKREGRRHRMSDRERHKSRNREENDATAPYKPLKSTRNGPTNSWKGRIRKRIQKPVRYTDRSPSPAASSFSHDAESSTSLPFDIITGVDGNDSLVGVNKRGKTKSPAKRLDSASAGLGTLQDAKKKKLDKPAGSGVGTPARKRNSQTGMFLEFVKGAREGESISDFYHRESQNGKITAFVRMGILYEEGNHVSCDYGLAFSCYQRAAAAGDGEGQFRLARCYEDGRGVSKNEPAAAALFIQAADADNAQAQFKAGVCFEEGRGVARDMNKALHYLYKSVEQRNPDACYRLAKCYLEGKGIKKDDARALELYRAASDADHVPSMVQLANMYAKGMGGAKRSIAKAVSLYRRASDAGNPDAKLSLGLLHEDGQGVKKSSESALRLYREAADAGFAPAMTALGQCFLWGYGVKQEFRKAVDLFRSAAKQGDSLAQHELGNCYKDGSGVEKDYTKALHYYKKASASGSSVALVQYGEFLYGGQGVPQDYEKAFEQFRRAADLGAAEGYRWLGECYADGTGVGADPKKAVQMYQKGADLGSSNAQTCLGVCYENAIGVDQSKSKALHWYKKAAKEGNPTAMNNLGIFYEQGRLVKRDPKRAATYYQKAIDLGSVDAICNLADCFAAGNGVERDMKTAVQLYQDAANHGMPGAKCELGVCYYYGKGVRRNTEKAADLFKEASDSEPEALRHLGTCFFDGNGVQRDYVAAFRLYKKAISRGNRDANFNLAMCYSHGKGVSKDERTAVSLLMEAADHGNRYAKLTLGNRYFEGRGVKKDITRAVALFQEAGEIDFTQPLTDDRIVHDAPNVGETNS